VRIKLLCAVAFCAVLCGTALADPIQAPTSWSCAGYTTATCGFSIDAVTGNPGLTPVPDLNNPPDLYRAAAAMFQINTAGTLDVWLSNISLLDIREPIYILTAMMFDVGSGANNHANLLTFTPVSATLASDATIKNPDECYPSACTSTTPTNVGGEWGYERNIGYPDHFPTLPAPQYGISSSGLSPWFGPANFNGPDLANPEALDGTQFGITSLGDNATGDGNDNGDLKGNALIHPGAAWGGVHFQLTYSGGTLDVSRINNVLFAYNTAPGTFTWPNCITFTPTVNGDTSLPPNECGGTNEVPEPASLILVGSGFLGLAGFLRRRLS